MAQSNPEKFLASTATPGQDPDPQTESTALDVDESFNRVKLSPAGWLRAQLKSYDAAKNALFPLIFCDMLPLSDGKA